jgi:hypothetical protein
MRWAGTLVRRVSHNNSLNYIAGTQDVRLWQENSKRNDVYITNLVDLYGNPLFI